jgi:hypothetical protein
MDQVRPKDLLTAARAADALVYAVGAAGVVAGGLLFRDGAYAFALVAWVLTFVGGVGLRLTAWAARALVQLLERTEDMAEDLAALRRDRAADPLGRSRANPDDPPDPYRRWSGWH